MGPHKEEAGEPRAAVRWAQRRLLRRRETAKVPRHARHVLVLPCARIGPEGCAKTHASLKSLAPQAGPRQRHASRARSAAAGAQSITEAAAERAHRPATRKL